MRRLATLLQRFRHARDGNIAVLFAFCATPLVMMTGLAVDYGRLVHGAHTVQPALDSAALAAARAQWEPAMNDERLVGIAQQFFDANADKSVMTCAPLQMSRNADRGAITLKAACTQQRQFGAMVIDTDATADLEAEAIYRPLDIDLSMMLDVSGSMGGRKLKDLKRAAGILIDNLVQDSGDALGEVRIGLAPYSTSVNAGDYYETLTGETPPSRRNERCVTERTNRHALTDAAPDDEERMFPELNDASRCPDAPIRPLSANADALRGHLAALRAGGRTAGHLGIAHAWYQVSHRWADIWPESARPLAKNAPHSMKVVILMTDGMFNEEFGGPGSSNEQSRRLCDAMKDDGVVVFSVAFQAPSSARRLLRDCATDASYYFQPESGAELSGAYERIANTLSQMRIAR